MSTSRRSRTKQATPEKKAGESAPKRTATRGRAASSVRGTGVPKSARAPMVRAPKPVPPRGSKAEAAMSFDDEGPVVPREEDYQGDEYFGRVVDGGGSDGEAAAPLEVGWEAMHVGDEGLEIAPLVAIVGRPNVGKSRLFNRMTGTRFAIVEDMPGVTRDRQYGDGQWDGRRFHVVDTGGFEPESSDVLLRQMREQARLAIREADRIIFLLDGQAGVLPADREIADLLRQTQKPVFFAVNKIDGAKHEANLTDFWDLGAENIYGISAEHGRNYDELMDALLEGVPSVDDVKVDDTLVKVAVLGRPNAGKSTLVNRLLGEERLLTSDIPGTTRDAINTYLIHCGQRYLFIDTAGVRRRRSIDEQVEKYAVVQSFKAIDRSDVVVYVIDAVAGITAQDQRMIGMVVEKGRALVIVLNKWDAVQKDHRTADEYVKLLRELLHFASFAPIITMSAKTGLRANRIFPLILSAHEQFIRRITTSQLNTYVRAALQKNPPKSWGNQRLKIYYASQVATRPPTFMFSVNDPDIVHFSYRRYLVNMLRGAFTFEGAPVKMFFRGRKKGESETEFE